LKKWILTKLSQKKRIMSENNIAYRYAKPLLDMAIEQKQLEEVNRDMTLLRNACRNTPELLAVLRNPIIRGYKKFAILKAIFEKEISPLTLGLLKLMGDKNRENLLFETSKVFEQLYNEEKGILEVKVTTTLPLSTDLRSALMKKLEAGLKKTIKLEEVVDESLIGGFVINIGNNLLDNSLKAALKRLKLDFTQKVVL